MIAYSKVIFFSSLVVFVFFRSSLWIFPFKAINHQAHVQAQFHFSTKKNAWQEGGEKKVFENKQQTHQKSM